MKPTGYLYEELLLLLRQEVQESGIYCAIVSTKTGETSSKCLKYINTLCELGILYKEILSNRKSENIPGVNMLYQYSCQGLFIL